MVGENDSARGPLNTMHVLWRALHKHTHTNTDKYKNIKEEKKVGDALQITTTKLQEI